MAAGTYYSVQYTSSGWIKPICLVRTSWWFLFLTPILVIGFGFFLSLIYFFLPEKVLIMSARQTPTLCPAQWLLSEKVQATFGRDGMLHRCGPRKSSEKNNGSQRKVLLKVKRCNVCVSV